MGTSLGQVAATKTDSVEIILSSSLNDTTKSNALLRIILGLNTSKDYSLAKTFSLKGLEYFKKKENIICFIQISELYGDACLKLKEFDSSVFVFKNTLELAENISDNLTKKRIMAKFYFKTGKAYERISYDSSITYYTRSHEKYLSFKNNRNDSIIHVNGLSMLAFSYLMTGNVKGAYEIAEQAAKVADKLKDNQMKSQTYGVLGTILNELNLFDKAVTTLQVAAEAGLAANDSAKVGQSYNGIALVYLKQGNYPGALKYYYKALEYINRNTSSYQYTTICYNVIYVLCELDSVKRAEYFLKELTENVTTVKTDKTYFSSLIIICNYYIKQDDLSKADEFMQRATEILPLFRTQHQRMDYYLTRTNLFKAKGDYRNSFESLKLHQLYKDSISSKETAEMVAEKNTLYETEKKEQQIKLLQKDNEIKTVKELRSKQIRNFSFAGIAALLVFGGFTFYRYKQRKKLSEKLSGSLTELRTTQNQLIKTERLMEQENVRLRISRDIHDEIGSSLTKIALLSELASDEVLTNASEARDSLLSIAEYSRNVNASLGEIVWAVNPEQDTLDLSLAYMRNYIHLFLNDTGINCKVNFPEVEENRSLDPILKRNLFLVLKEGLNNSLKYSNAKNIEVIYLLNGNQFELLIKDDGIGFDLENQFSKGNGLKNMMFRMEQTGCKLTITSSAGNGCAIFARGNIV